MLGNRLAGGGDNQCRGRGDIEGGGAIAARATGIEQAGRLGMDMGGGGAHGLRRTGEYVRGFTTNRKPHQ